MGGFFFSIVYGSCMNQNSEDKERKFFTAFVLVEIFSLFFLLFYGDLLWSKPGYFFPPTMAVFPIESRVILFFDDMLFQAKPEECFFFQVILSACVWGGVLKISQIEDRHRMHKTPSRFRAQLAS